MKTIISNDSEGKCYICGKQANHVHHMLHGSMRSKADKYGLTCHLCYDCHQKLHDRGVMDKELQRIAQAYFESKHGHKKFIEVFGKNFI